MKQSEFCFCVLKGRPADFCWFGFWQVNKDFELNWSYFIIIVRHIVSIPCSLVPWLNWNYYSWHAHSYQGSLLALPCEFCVQHVVPVIVNNGHTGLYRLTGLSHRHSFLPTGWNSRPNKSGLCTYQFTLPNASLCRKNSLSSWSSWTA